MSIYRLWVVDHIRELRPIQGTIARRLTGWLDPIAKKANFSAGECVFPQYIVNPGVGEMLIHVCPFGTSVVQKMPGAVKPNPTASHLGMTQQAGGVTGAEVYKKTSDAEGIASIIFHEAMHNKLQLGDAGLHGRFTPCELSCASITWPTSPTSDESDAMAAALRNPVAQWLNGQRILRSAGMRKRKNDPLWDSEIVL